MLDAHSYEEVAYDLIPLAQPRPNLGLGRFGPLKQPRSVNDLLTKIRKNLNTKALGIIGPTNRRVTRAAVSAGSCGLLLRQVIRHKCDFYLTGELKHHHALELQQAGVTTVCTSHSVSERFMLTRIARRLRRQCSKVQFIVSRKDRDPFTWSL